MTDPTALIAAVAGLTSSQRVGMVRRLYAMAQPSAGFGAFAPVWLALGALAADVSAAERRALDDLELALDDGEVGAIVDGELP